MLRVANRTLPIGGKGGYSIAVVILGSALFLVGCRSHERSTSPGPSVRSLNSLSAPQPDSPRTNASGYDFVSIFPPGSREPITANPDQVHKVTLLKAVAISGGLSTPPGSFVTVTRGGQIWRYSEKDLSLIEREPERDVRLQAGDVVRIESRQLEGVER